MLTLCFLLTAYAGPIDAATPRVDLSHECKAYKLVTAQRMIAKCVKAGPLACEVTIAPNGTITLESKVRTK